MAKPKKIKKTILTSEEKAAKRNRAGKCFEKDFVEAIAAAEKPEQLSSNYVLGLVMTRAHASVADPAFIDWRRINNALEDKFGAAFVEAFKAYARDRVNAYGLEGAKMESAAQAVAAVLREAAKRE